MARRSGRQRRTQRRRKAHRRRWNILNWFCFERFFRGRFHNRRFYFRSGRSRRKLSANGLGGGSLGPRRFVLRLAVFACHALPDKQRHVFVERAGMRLFFSNTQLSQRFENHVGFNFELAGQLIDANFAHTMTFRQLQAVQP